jgi:rubrerythrin
MNIYEYAMKLEKDGERFYRDLAEKIEDKGIKSIFIMLAEEEIKHYIIFEKMNKQQSFTTQHSTHLIKHTLALFRKIREENPHFSFSRSYIES